MLGKELARRLAKVGPINRLEKNKEQVKAEIPAHLRKSSFMQGSDPGTWVESPAVTNARLDEEYANAQRFRDPNFRCSLIVNKTYNFLNYHKLQCDDLAYKSTSTAVTNACEAYATSATTGDLSNTFKALWNKMYGVEAKPETPPAQIYTATDTARSTISVASTYLNNYVDLQDVLMSGYTAWTSQDWSDLAYCGSKSMASLVNLEESGKIPLDALFVVQGDMIMEDSHTIYPWQGGIVNYCISGLPQPSTWPYTADNLQSAISEIQAQIGDNAQCLRFNRVSVSSTNANSCSVLPSIMVRSNAAAPGCWSHVGQVSGYYTNWMSRSQIINLGPGCEPTGMILHQLLHALGLPHEFARNDRTAFLQVNKSQVLLNSAQQGLKTNAQRFSIYDKYPDSAENTAQFPGDVLDYLSIMMPPSTTFTQDPTTFQALKAPIDKRYMGQRMGMSELDVRHLADLYSCPAETVIPMYATKNLNAALVQGSGFVRDGSCVDQAYTGVGYVDGSGVQHPYSCADIAQKQWCTGATQIITTRAQMRCPYTCLQCIQAPTTLQYLNTTAVPAKHKTWLPGPRYTFRIDADRNSLPRSW